MKKTKSLYRVKLLPDCDAAVIEAENPLDAVRKYHRECCGRHHPPIGEHSVSKVSRPSRARKGRSRK